MRRKKRKGWPQGGREVGERYKERESSVGRGRRKSRKDVRLKGNVSRAGMRKKKRMLLGV